MRSENRIYSGMDRSTILVLQRIIKATILDRIRCIITGYGMLLRFDIVSARCANKRRNSGPTAPVASIAIGSTFGALLYLACLTRSFSLARSEVK